MAPLHYPGLGFLVIVLLVHREGTRLFQNCVGPGRLLHDTWRESGIRSDGAFYESHSLNGSKLATTRKMLAAQTTQLNLFFNSVQTKKVFKQQKNLFF